MRFWPTKDGEPETIAAGIREPVPMPDDHMPCLACGIAVPSPLDRGAIIEARPTHRLAGPTTTTLNIKPVPMTRCASCAGALNHVAAIFGRHPRLRARLGNAMALHHGESVMAALAVLGVPAPDLTVSRAEMASHIHHLAAGGAAARWITRFAPLQQEHARPSTCSPHPWAHVSEAIRANLRSAYAAVLREHLAETSPPVRLTPPMLSADNLSGPTPATAAVGGCLFCGLGGIEVSARQVARMGGRAASAAQVWTRRKVSPSSLGGRPAPTLIEGHTCPACTTAIDTTGAIGPSALDSAVANFLGAGDRWDAGRDSLDGVIGWGALVARAARTSSPRPEPNATPWAHVAGLDALARRIAVTT